MPFVNTLHVDKLLSNISIKYANAEYIADQVFPIVPVQKDSDVYRVWTRNFRLPETKRANRGVAREHDFEVTTNAYLLEKHALKMYVSDSDAQNYDEASLKADATSELTDVILKRLENSVAQLFTSTSWSLNVSLSAAQQFDGTTTANPIPIFDTGCSVVLGNSGVMPNFGILPRKAYIASKNNGNVLDRVKYTSQEMDQVILARLFGLNQLLVPNSQIDSSNLGAAESIASIWDDNAFVGFKPPAPGPLKPSCGYIFKNMQPMVKVWREEERSSDAVEVNMWYNAKIVASLTGYLIKDCTV